MKAGLRRRVTRRQTESLYFESSDGRWSILTDDLLETVFMLLPLHDLLMMRSVCKRWQRITSTASFIGVYSHKAPKNHWFLMFPEAAGGLLCYAHTLQDQHSSTQDWKCLFVCNPVTRTFKRLPYSTKQRLKKRSAQMIVEPETGAYKVLVAIGINSMLLGYDTLEVYDSRTKSWSVKNFIPEGYCEPWVTYNSTFFDGSVYFSFTKDGYLSSYTVEGLEWSMTPQDIFPTYTKPRPTQLFVSQGRLCCLVGREERCGNARVLSLMILEFDQTKLPGWSPVSRVPPLFGEYPGAVRAMGHIDSSFICVTSTRCPRVLLYNRSENSWTRISNFPDYGHLPKCGPSSAFPFEPRLDILV
ncbi:hypothetical protein M758_12G094500 [Ceratodon purpureus]|uniref:F-box domain-containing protein n=1 Tax=Ceratodon purpureus TaxID=3225 RepID=A0A8T0G5T8_CERPU|nr:hypothetical protein KC19_12G091100 [Ceratodon purpureus]KAG0598703.1 hypothetical protein M758_12G094500 [Ceratodon purpureus]